MTNSSLEKRSGFSLDEENKRITEILRRTTIKFPWDLTLEQAKGLIRYVCINLPGTANYFYSQYIVLREDSFSDEERLKEEEKTSIFHGMISKKIK